MAFKVETNMKRLGKETYLHFYTADKNGKRKIGIMVESGKKPTIRKVFTGQKYETEIEIIEE
jgi:hypothetical protein